MSDIDVLTFADALEQADEIHNKRHLLLGNGFSIACRPDCFTYGSLLDEADLSALSVAGDALFESEGTADFEEVIRALSTAARMADFYDSSDPDFAERLRGDAEALKQALAETLAKKHPDNVGEIEDSEYQAAREFLANFSYIFTLSYDLLLYWALMQEMDPEVPSDDGFRADPDDVDADWVVWDNLQPHNQNVFFMHGGLHLYDEGPILKKLTFSRTGIALVDQIRTALDQGAYPLVVTEGTSPEKLAKILHHTYLGRGLRSLAACQGSLFVHGHSLAENDAHIFRAVAEGRFRAMFVSLHGNPDSGGNREIQARASALAEHRSDRRALAVYFYDADSAAAWG